MKRYEKPTVEIYTLSGNETICGGCITKLCNDDALNELMTFYDGADTDGNGKISKAEAQNLFGTGEDCSIKIDQYCKFTSNGNVSWS